MSARTNALDTEVEVGEGGGRGAFRGGPTLDRAAAPTEPPRTARAVWAGLIGAVDAGFATESVIRDRAPAALGFGGQSARHETALDVMPRAAVEWRRKAGHRHAGAEGGYAFPTVLADGRDTLAYPIRGLVIPPVLRRVTMSTSFGAGGVEVRAAAAARLGVSGTDIRHMQAVAAEVNRRLLDGSLRFDLGAGRVLPPAAPPVLASGLAGGVITWVDRFGDRFTIIYDFDWWGLEVYLDCNAAQLYQAILEAGAVTALTISGINGLTGNVPAAVVALLVAAAAEISAIKIGYLNNCRGVTISQTYLGGFYMTSGDTTGA